MFLYVKIHFRAVAKIKTLNIFMIGEDNRKKRSDRLCISIIDVMATYDVIDVRSLFHLYTMSETIMGIYCVNFRSITPILYFLLIFSFIEVAAPLNSLISNQQTETILFRSKTCLNLKSEFYLPAFTAYCADPLFSLI